MMPALLTRIAREAHLPGADVLIPTRSKAGSGPDPLARLSLSMSMSIWPAATLLHPLVTHTSFALPLSHKPRLEGCARPLR